MDTLTCLAALFPQMCHPVFAKSMVLIMFCNVMVVSMPHNALHSKCHLQAYWTCALHWVAAPRPLRTA